ncbi:hypothetical protein BV22DRAFT_1099083 [Leucogyrophana mollusca]|uniref:Uncharacterized protein n=1 Tax=Leucogyrophana mollusca TaxID=85980 RepID=A0ACB8B1U2_9AGAM|nr:hypothetical protein BV22DRAFT_1099083 [Leucogyrophana mollusca]
MSIYVYELPTTGAISFADFCVDQSPAGTYAAHLAEATQARANLRGVLKESKRTDRDDKDYLRLVKVLDEYLPQLYAVMACVAAGEIALRSEPMFSWRTTLSAHLFNASPRLALPSLHYDLAASLLTYAFALSNLASALIATYDRDAEPGKGDERIGFAVNLLCRAAGVLGTLAEGVLPAWEREGGGVGRPVDLSREVVGALAKSTLAAAQSLAIRKLLSKATADALLAPGPPLPKSHPSPALLAKLHLECAALYGGAGALFSKGSGSGSGAGAGAGGEITPALKRHLSSHTALHTTLAHKWLGVDAGEGERSGEAVGFLTWARKGLEELRGGGIGGGGSGGAGEGKGKGRGKGKGVVQEELESVSVFLAHYTKINDSLSFQPVPKQRDLQARIPAGRLAVATKPYAPPRPAFGPGSAGWEARSQGYGDAPGDGGRRTEVDDLGDALRRADLGCDGEGEATDGDGGGNYAPQRSTAAAGAGAGTYAGAGSYF